MATVATEEATDCPEVDDNLELIQSQSEDPQYRALVNFLESGVLLSDPELSWKITSQKDQFVVLERFCTELILLQVCRRLCIQPWRRDTGGTECTETCIRTAEAVSLVLSL